MKASEGWEGVVVVEMVLEGDRVMGGGQGACEEGCGDRG